MRTREQVQRDIDAPGLTGPTIPNADRLTLEMLLDIRDLLIDLYNRDADVAIDYGAERK